MRLTKEVTVHCSTKDIINRIENNENFELIRPLILKIKKHYEEQYRLHKEYYKKYSENPELTHKDDPSELIDWQKKCRDSSKEIVDALDNVLKRLDKVNTPLIKFHKLRGMAEKDTKKWMI